MRNYQIVEVANSNLKRWGREALAGNWGKAILGTLIFMLISAGPILAFTLFFNSDTIERVSDLYTFLVGGPITLGYVSFIMAIFRRKQASPVDVLHGFEHFFKAFLLMFITNLFIALWSLLFIIPGIIAAFRYSMSFYILADNPNMGVFEIINESKRMMMGNKMRLFLLQLSFIGWAILAMLTFGFGLIFLLPYSIATFVGFYEVARGNLKLNRQVESWDEAESQAVIGVIEYPQQESSEE